MFHNLSIRNKLVAGFGAIVAIILCLLILAYNNFARLSQANVWNRHTLEVLRELDTIATSVLQKKDAVNLSGTCFTSDVSTPAASNHRR